MATVEIAREDIVRRFADAINRRDANAVAALHAPDAVINLAIAPEGVRGRDAIRKFNENFAKAFQDVDFKLLSVIPKGDIVASEYVFTARQTGPFEIPTGTLPPTNRQVTVPGANFFRINREGLIAESRGYFDVAGLLQQLGVKP